MATFKITLAYDGTAFVGWQRQASGTSIQGLVEDALRPLAGCEVAVAGAGRTDAGVHALCQVASFRIGRTLDAAVIVRAMNARLPPEVRVLAAEPVPDSFHARFAARTKSYLYRIWNDEVLNPFERQYAWHLVGPLDVAAMATAARFIEGEHDFAAFQAAGGRTASTARRVFSSRIDRGLRIPGGGLGSADCGLEPAAAIDDRAVHSISIPQSAIRNPASAVILYAITGDGFLRHMVRAIVGSLVEVGRGRHPPEWIRDLLAGRDRAAAGPTAPAQGLFLVSVDYGAMLAAEP